MERKRKRWRERGIMSVWYSAKEKEGEGEAERGH